MLICYHLLMNADPAGVQRVREAGYDLRQKDRLHVPMARTDIGQSSCKIKGARLWNNKFNLVNPYLHKKAFGRLS